jgi:hypothetical protein
MFALTEKEDLEKAGKSIGNFFKKQAAELEEGQKFYENVASQLDALQKTFAAHALSMAAEIEAMKAAAKAWGE